jgi:hypothetical protein
MLLSTLLHLLLLWADSVILGAGPDLTHLPRKCQSSRRFHGLQSDLIAKALEPPTQALLNPKAIPLAEVVGPQVKVRLLVGQHVVDNDEKGMSNGD